MIECVRKYKNLNKNFKLTNCLLKSKNIYESFRAEYEDRPNYIKNNLKIDWENVYLFSMQKECRRSRSFIHQMLSNQ